MDATKAEKAAVTNSGKMEKKCLES